MGTDELIIISLIVIAASLLSLFMRRVREPLMELESPLRREEALSALREALPGAGWAVETLNEQEGSISIRAKIKCFNLVLYWVWADRIIFSVTATSSSKGSRVLVTCRPAPNVPFIRKNNSLFITKDRVREILVQTLRGTVVRESFFAN